MNKPDTIVDLPRSMYKELKSMNREQMQQVLANIYEQGVKSVKQGAVDVQNLRTEIGKIKGIGEKRLDEIMSVIESFLSFSE